MLVSNLFLCWVQLCFHAVKISFQTEHPCVHSFPTRCKQHCQALAENCTYHDPENAVGPTPRSIILLCHNSQWFRRLQGQQCTLPYSYIRWSLQSSSPLRSFNFSFTHASTCSPCLKSVTVDQATFPGARRTRRCLLRVFVPISKIVWTLESLGCNCFFSSGLAVDALWHNLIDTANRQEKKAPKQLHKTDSIVFTI